MSEASTQLAQRIAQHVNELARDTDAARASAALQRYLDACARFHRYSHFNMWCILLTRPDATHVAGFHTWNRLGRHVKKGEKGIPILVPVRVKVRGAAPPAARNTRGAPTRPSDNSRDESSQDDAGVHSAEGDAETERHRLSFKVGYVFDVTQTEGQPLPPQPEWRSLEQRQALQERLLAFAATVGIQVSVAPLPMGAQGHNADGAVTIAPEAGTKTLIHELAHALLRHSGSGRDQPSMELEAEAVAYVVARHFELEGLNCPMYLALWNADGSAILRRLEAIVRCASRIIAGVTASTDAVPADAAPMDAAMAPADITSCPETSARINAGTESRDAALTGARSDAERLRRSESLEMTMPYAM